MKTETTKQAALVAWDNATNGKPMTPLLLAIAEAIKATPDSDRDFSAAHQLHGFAKRIAEATTYCNIAALEYMNDWKGEWEVTNYDLEIWARFRMWLSRFGGEDNVMTGALTQDISRAMANKRMQQAYDRYQKSGLTTEHCGLLQNLLWKINTGRGDGISIYVEGKRPFGNSSIEYDIHEHAGWKMDWPEDSGPSDEQNERAWNLFDELVFAAADASKVACANLSNNGTHAPRKENL